MHIENQSVAEQKFHRLHNNNNISISNNSNMDPNTVVHAAPAHPITLCLPGLKNPPTPCLTTTITQPKRIQIITSATARRAETWATPWTFVASAVRAVAAAAEGWSTPICPLAITSAP